MSRMFRPAAECLEVRLAMNGKMGENIEPLTMLTDRARNGYNQAYANVQSLESLYQRVGGAISQSQVAGAVPDLGGIKDALDSARAIVAKEHRVANSMRLVNLAEKVVIRDYRKHAPVDDSQFRAWHQQFQYLDNWVTHQAVPYINKADAYVNSLLRP